MTMDQAQLDALESLCQYGAEAEEIAAHLGLDLTELKRSPEYKDAAKRGDAKRRLLLRQAEMKRALAGDQAALRRLLPSSAEAIEQEGTRRLAEYLALRAR